jgi:head-tail adaptor
MRLRRGTRIFWIGATQDPDETRRYLICQCEERGE